MAPLRHGVAPHLEAEADRLIKESLQKGKLTRGSADILTPARERKRREREVFNITGVAEPQTRRGIYGRAKNADAPHLNSMDGAAAVRRRGFHDSLSDHVDAPQPTASPMDDFWR